jgi:hypothetical protein
MVLGGHEPNPGTRCTDTVVERQRLVALQEPEVQEFGVGKGL